MLPFIRPVLLSLFVFITSIALGQDGDKVARLLPQAQDFLRQGKFEEAAGVYKEVLKILPNDAFAMQKLSEAEEEILFKQIRNEINVVDNAEKYIHLYGESGKYYNPARDALLTGYEALYYLEDDVLKLEIALLRQEQYLQTREGAILGRLVSRAREFSRYAEEQKDWERLMLYSEKIIEYSGDAVIVADAKEKLHLARRKTQKSGAYTGVGYLYNTAMPTGIYITRLKQGSTEAGFFSDMGWYLSAQANDVFFLGNDVLSSGLTDVTPPLGPDRQIRVLQRYDRKMLALNAGITYQVKSLLYVYAGLGLLHHAEVAVVDEYQRESFFGTALFEGEKYYESNAEIAFFPEFGVEIKLLNFLAVRYGVAISNHFEGSSIHKVGLSLGLSNK